MLDESTREDTVIEFSSSSSSLYSSSNILIAPRSDDFNERTWWMVDIEMNCKTTTNQGATPLVKRCMRVYNWDIEKARKVLLAYQQFLSLKNQYKDWDSTILSPSIFVDEMWRQHVLDVVNYTHDMMLLCGHMVGYNPDGNEYHNRVKKSMDRIRHISTRNALEANFPNKYDKEIWEIYEKEDYEEEDWDDTEEEEGESVVLSVPRVIENQCQSTIYNSFALKDVSCRRSSMESTLSDLREEEGEVEEDRSSTRLDKDGDIGVAMISKMMKNRPIPDFDSVDSSESRTSSLMRGCEDDNDESEKKDDNDVSVKSWIDTVLRRSTQHCGDSNQGKAIRRNTMM